MSEVINIKRKPPKVRHDDNRLTLLTHMHISIKCNNWQRVQWLVDKYFGEGYSVDSRVSGEKKIRLIHATSPVVVIITKPYTVVHGNINILMRGAAAPEEYCDEIKTRLNQRI